MSAKTTTRSLSRLQKMLLSITAIAVTASMAGLGSFATFTDTESGSTPIDTGVVDIQLGADNTADNRLSVAATDIVPGDTIERAVNLSTNNTTSDLASIELSTTSSTANLLTSDTTDGLQMVIDECSVAWTESASAPYTYECSGTPSTVLASRAIIGTDLALTGLDLTPGTTDYLRVTATLPSSAGNDFQNLDSTVSYAFTGTQRAATAK